MLRGDPVFLSLLFSSTHSTKEDDDTALSFPDDDDDGVGDERSSPIGCR